MYLEKWSEKDIFMESVDQGGHNSLPGPGQTGKGRVALPYPRQCRPNLPPGGGHEACGIARDSVERAEREARLEDLYRCRGPIHDQEVRDHRPNLRPRLRTRTTRPELPGCSRINDHPIDLVDDKLPPCGPIYSLGADEQETQGPS